MSLHYVEFVRHELRDALADHQRRQKGQLEAFEDSPQTETRRFPRKRRTELDGNGQRVMVPGDPVPGVETRARTRPGPPITPALYSSSSWRRALARMDAPGGPWLRYVYADDLDFAGQELMIKWLWSRFLDWLGDRRIAKKVRARFGALTWLAAQDVKRELNGGEIYGPAELARLVDANVKGWHATYAGAWEALRMALIVMDRQSLIELSRRRSHERKEGQLSYLAKLDKTS